MRFKVDRSSDKVPPCKEAIEGTYVYVDERTVNDPKETPDPDDWYERGENHRVEHGHIKRDFHEPCWFVDIASLDDLIAFTKKYGSLVFDDEKIEIYDYYRE